MRDKQEKSAEENISDLSFFLRLTTIQATVTRRLDNALSNVHGISFVEYMVLHHLHHAAGDRLRRGELAERIGLTASGITRMLLPLEKLGYVARETDARDARVGYVTLTKGGKRLYADSAISANAIANEVAAPLTSEQVKLIYELMGKLTGS